MSTRSIVFALAILTAGVGWLPDPYSQIGAFAIAAGLAILQHLKDGEDEDKETYINELLGKIDKNTTGGKNRPKIFIEPFPLRPAPGQEGRSREHMVKYKSARITIMNEGDTPIRDLEILISGSLGVDVHEVEPGPFFAQKPAKHKLSDTTLAPGRSILVLQADYSSYHSTMDYIFNVSWEFGFYTLSASYTSTPLGGLFLQSRELQVGHNKIDYDEYFRNENI